MTKRDTTKFKNKYLTYSAKNILREAAFMFIVLCISAALGSEMTWKYASFNGLASILYGVGSIAIHRYFYKKGDMYIPPEPKFSTKTWEEHQADKSISKDA